MWRSGDRIIRKWGENEEMTCNSYYASKKYLKFRKSIRYIFIISRPRNHTGWSCTTVTVMILQLIEVCAFSSFQASVILQHLTGKNIRKQDGGKDNIELDRYLVIAIVQSSNCPVNQFIKQKRIYLLLPSLRSKWIFWRHRQSYIKHDALFVSFEIKRPHQDFW